MWSGYLCLPVVSSSDSEDDILRLVEIFWECCCSSRLAILLNMLSLIIISGVLGKNSHSFKLPLLEFEMQSNEAGDDP